MCCVCWDGLKIEKKKCEHENIPGLEASRHIHTYILTAFKLTLENPHDLRKTYVKWFYTVENIVLVLYTL